MVNQRDIAAGVRDEQLFFVLSFSAIGCLVLVIFGLTNIFLESRAELGRLEVASGLVLALNIGILRLPHGLAIARTTLILTMITVLMVMLATGGVQGTGIFWFFVFPAAAFFLTSRTGGIMWHGLLYLLIFIMVLCEQMGYVRLAYSITTIRQLAISLFVVAIGIYIYQQSREKSAAVDLENRSNLRTAQREVAQERVKAEIILDTIDEGVIATDDMGKILLFNRAAEEMLGWRLNEVAGKELVKTLPMYDALGEPLPTYKQPLTAMSSDPHKVFSDTLMCRRKDGSSFPAAVTGSSMVIAGNTQGMVLSFRDITEERAIDRAKSEFVTLASHQLRTPISAIAWFSEMLLGGDAGKLNEEQHEHINQIYFSSQRMATLVGEMLLVSSLELGNQPVKVKITSLPKLLKEVLAEQEKNFADKKITVKEHYEPSVPELLVDPEMTRIIMQNLLSNALKYTPNKGNVSVEISLSPQQLRPDSKGSVGIIVSDSGYGIPKSARTKIFEKFFRADNIKSRDTDGTGLGLYVVKHLLDYVGGRISFMSEEGTGSTFVILIPLEGMISHGSKTSASETKATP